MFENGQGCDAIQFSEWTMKAPDNPFERIAAGIMSSWQNADRLLSDVHYLLEGKRFSSARFLLATAREEIAKAYILVDACKLDFNKHEETLRRLCRAFYDHIVKHAYLHVMEHHNIHSMNDAKELWAREVHRWWPGDYEGGDPDMRHDTYFDRECPLYIDFVEYDENWIIPLDSDQISYFRYYLTNSVLYKHHPITKAQKLVEKWRVANGSGVLTPLVLQEINAAFKKHYAGEKATAKELDRLFERVAQQVEQKTGVAPDVFIDSVLVQWPLYCFPYNVKDYYSDIMFARR